MAYRIDPVKEDELRAVIELMWRADNAPDGTKMLHMIFSLDCRLHQILKWLSDDALLYLGDDKDPSDSYFFARQTGTDKIVAVSNWTWEGLAPPADEEGRKLQCMDWFDEQVPPIESMNRDLFRSWFIASYVAHARTVGSKPYAILDTIATEPSCKPKEQQDAAEELLKEGLARVDRKGVACYVCARESEKALYERYGFVVQIKVNFDARDHGGLHEAANWAMMRPARRVGAGDRDE